MKLIDKLMEVQRFYWFIIFVLFLKIMLMGMFSSDYQNKMFVPFVDMFVKQFGTDGFNPYDVFYSKYGFVAFPYPPLMLLFESIFIFLSNLIGVQTVFIKNVLFKLPSLVFDLIGLYYLIKLYPHKKKYIGVLYFASPIILYAVYMHGQLDIIPTVLFLGSVYYLLKDGKHYKAYFLAFFVLALLTKLHILAALPLICIFLGKKYGWGKAILVAGLALFIMTVLMLPFFSEVFLKSVLFNNEQNLLTQVYLSFVDLKLYLPILALLFVYLQEYMINNINKDLLMSFCGILFAVFLALLPPMPGWYVWVVPFIAIFFINAEENKYKNLHIYCLFNLFYLGYFVTAHNSGYVDLYYFNKDMSFLKINDSIYRNMLFTLLTGFLIYIIVSFYQLGIASNSFYKRKGMPFTIGISGDSGTGKSTMIQLLTSCFSQEKLLYIEGDGDHKWERGESMWETFTHLNPKANYLYRQAKDIQMLRKGDKVRRVYYNHDTGKFTEGYLIKPNKYILLCGLHAFYLPQMRKVLDLKIYMDTDENLRRYWKIQRDVAFRGYTKEEILAQIERRVEDAKRYILPQREYADLIIHYFDEKLIDCCVDQYTVTLSLKVVLSAAINIEPLIDELEQYQIAVRYDFNEDLEKQVVIFDGDSLIGNKIPFERIKENVIPQADELTTENINDKSNIEGIIALLILLIISYKMRGALT